MPVSGIAARLDIINGGNYTKMYIRERNSWEVILTIVFGREGVSRIQPATKDEEEST